MNIDLVGIKLNGSSSHSGGVRKLSLKGERPDTQFQSPGRIKGNNLHVRGAWYGVLQL